MFCSLCCGWMWYGCDLFREESGVSCWCRTLHLCQVDVCYVCCVSMSLVSTCFFLFCSALFFSILLNDLCVLFCLSVHVDDLSCLVAFHVLLCSPVCCDGEWDVEWFWQVVSIPNKKCVPCMTCVLFTSCVWKWSGVTRHWYFFTPVIHSLMLVCVWFVMHGNDWLFNVAKYAHVWVMFQLNPSLAALLIFVTHSFFFLMNVCGLFCCVWFIPVTHTSFHIALVRKKEQVQSSISQAVCFQP
jgi:hypothetical protein